MTLFCKLKTNIMFMDHFSQKYLTRLSVSCYCEPVGAMLCRSSSRHSPPPSAGLGSWERDSPFPLGPKGISGLSYRLCLFQHTDHQKLCVAGYFNLAVCMLTWKFNGDTHFTSAPGRPLQFGSSQIRFSSFCIWCPDCLISLLDLSGLVCYLI